MVATLTIAEIAQRLGLPESTVRYYRDHFADYIPMIGEGRQRRYPAEAVEVFQVIADTLRKDHGTATEVEEALNRLFPRNAVTTAEPPQTAAGQQQSLPQLAEQIAVVLRQQQEALERQNAMLTQQTAAVETLTQELMDLKRQLAERDDAREQRLEERDQALVATMRRLLERQQPPSFWQRLFRSKPSSDKQNGASS